MSRNALVVRILIGFVAGILAGVGLSEFCAPGLRGSVVSWVEPFGTVLVAMLKTVV